MMFFDYIKNTGLVEEIYKLTDQLKSLNAYAVMLDLAVIKSQERSTLKLNNNAERAAWHDGYTEALRDVFYFRELITSKLPATDAAPRLDYGAYDTLLKNGDITLDEYRKFTSARNNS